MMKVTPLNRIGAYALFPGSLLLLLLSGCVGSATCPGCGSGNPGLLDPSRTTAWNPGILTDTPTGQPLGPDGIPVRNTPCNQPVPSGSALQTALNNCPANTVLTLPAGTFTVPTTIYIPSNVVLRGAGSIGSGATILVLQTGQHGPVVAMQSSGLFDQSCYGNRMTTVILTQDAAKEQNKVMIAPQNPTFAAGDIAIIDQQNTSEVSPGDCSFYQRTAGHNIGEKVEIASVDPSTGTLTLTTPLHWTFTTSSGAAISKVNSSVTQWAGLEHVWLQGGNNPVYPVGGSYDGAFAAGVDISNAKYCWVKDVQTDGSSIGMHVAVTSSYRCVVRDSHFHNSSLYGFGTDNYGIVLRCGTADSLVENNIARYMNKPIQFNVSGGGNVVGYNYAANSWACDARNDSGWQEDSIDTHCSFPHMELIEGNWGTKLGADTTHGNAGYLTFFRNYASSQSASSPIVWGVADTPQYGDVASMTFPLSDIKMTVIGNILGSTTNSSLGVPVSIGTARESNSYASTDISLSNIYRIGGTADVSWTTMVRGGNFDTVNGRVMWDSTLTPQTLPASLYYRAKPAWWPGGYAWPWAGPDVTPMVGKLPAKDIADAFNYNIPTDRTCTLNCAQYYCLSP